MASGICLKRRFDEAGSILRNVRMYETIEMAVNKPQSKAAIHRLYRKVRLYEIPCSFSFVLSRSIWRVMLFIYFIRRQFIYATMLPRNYANCIVRTTSSFQLSNFRIENVPIEEVRSKIAINIAVTAKYFSVNLSGNQLHLQRIVTAFGNLYACRNIIRIVTRRDCRDYADNVRNQFENMYTKVTRYLQ